MCFEINWIELKCQWQPHYAHIRTHSLNHPTSGHVYPVTVTNDDLSSQTSLVHLAMCAK